MIENGPEITYFLKNSHGLMCFTRNGPGIVDFVKNTADVMILVENSLVMSYFGGKLVICRFLQKMVLQ